ncbi:hypothetical protein [Brachybacterium endophyticum]|uniref:hypothetical protein n=1 Tax=Brachybacterium endophyticum TaxID=2182385 RepID=UPI003B836011
MNAINPTVVMTEMSAWYWGGRRSRDLTSTRCPCTDGRSRPTSRDRSCSCSGTTPR